MCRAKARGETIRLHMDIGAENILAMVKAILAAYRMT